MGTISEYFKDPSIVMRALGRRGLLCWMSDETFVKMMFRFHEGRRIDLNDPKSLNEKLQWLKLYDRDPKYTEMVDKYRVKDYIKKTIGEEYVIKTLGVWENANDIDFGALPNRFVLKTNHDSHSIIICKDKKEFDERTARKALNRSLKNNGYWYGREWPYKNVKPCILAEEYLQNTDGTPLIDYKFYCYGGQPIYFMVSYGEAEHNVRNHKFDMQCNSIDHLFKKTPAIKAEDAFIPSNISEMINIVKELCGHNEHIRIDLYNIDGKIYFGEITYYSSAGFMNICSQEYSDYLASLIHIPPVLR